VELVIAVNLSVIVMVGFFAIITMARQFLEEGFVENLQRTRTDLFLEHVRQALTFSYGWDADLPGNRPAISQNNGRIDFVTPDDTGDDVPERYAMFLRVMRTVPGDPSSPPLLDIEDNAEQELVLQKGGQDFQTLGHVTVFRVDQKEGEYALVLTARRNIGLGSRHAQKLFTVVTRALPRNKGEMAYIGTNS
jgi:hypothetical protein